MLNLFLFFVLLFFVISYITKKKAKDNDIQKIKIPETPESDNTSINNKGSLPPNLARRSELKKLLDSNFSKEDKNYIMNLFHYKCYKCGNPHYLEIDHHVPLTIGYPLKEGHNYNAVILCKNCNRKKSDSLPQEFYTDKELKILENKYNIKAHLNIDSNKINKINKILISEKIKILNKAIEENKAVSFLYIEMGKNQLFHDKYHIKAVPLEIYENMKFYMNHNRKFYVLKAENLETNKIKDFEIMFMLDLEINN